MSRIGRKILVLPKGVSVSQKTGMVGVKGPKGELLRAMPSGVSFKIEGDKLTVERADDSHENRSKHGLMRAHLANMVKGVTDGYLKELEIQGVGFKANLKGSQLDLALGYSHPILMEIPAGIKVTVTEGTKLKIEGCDKQLVGAVTAEIRSYYPPEPYKGKGVRIVGEHAERVRRKEGKTVA